MTPQGEQKLNKYQEIVQTLRESIEKGIYPEGARLPSEHDLVRQTGASRPTIARALRELQALGMIRRRVGSGSFVQKQSKSAETKLFGLLIPRLGDTEIFESICGQITREAERAHYSLVWGDVSQSSDPDLIAQRTCEPYLRQRVTGVFFAPVELSAGKDELNRKIVKILSDAKIPIVLLDRDLTPYPDRSEFDLVGIDNFTVGFLLGRHLAKRGSKRMFFVAHPHSAETVQGRINGAHAALLAAGQTPRQDWVQCFDVNEVPLVKKLMDQHTPDAIICANDKTAAELQRSLSALSIRVPQKVRIVGVDDVRYAKLLNPGLTTVHQPCQAIGEVAMQVMLQRIAQPRALPRHVTLPVHLIERDSSR